MAALERSLLREVSPSWVLLVEDEPSSARLFVRAFERAGPDVPVVHAESAEEALRRLHDPGTGACGTANLTGLPTLVITDYRLPRLSGADLVRLIRRDPRLRPISCVVLSVSLDTHDILESYRAGANSFLVKPDSFSGLVQLLRAVLGFFFGQSLGKDGLS